MDNNFTFQPNKCPECGKAIQGRTDKRFCDAYCRNAYNNKVMRSHEQQIQAVNKQLRKNRSILKTLSPIGKTTVRKQVMMSMGYDFSVFSSLYRSSKGATYYLCHDYGCLPLQQKGVDKALIITCQDYMHSWNPWNYLHDSVKN